MTDTSENQGGFRIGKRLLMGAGIAMTGLVSIAMLLVGYKRKKETSPIQSPSGKFQAKTDVNHDKHDPARYLSVTVDILDAEGKPLHHEVTPCPHLQPWTIGWESDDRIVIDSEAVGRYVLTRETGDLWLGRLTPSRET